MPRIPSRENFLRRAGLITLSLTTAAAAIATLVHALQPNPQLLDVVAPPVVCVLFAILTMALLRWPERLGGIMRVAMLGAVLALAVPGWFYIGQSLVAPAQPLIDRYPPISAMLLGLMVMGVVYLPGRQAVVAVALCWLLVAAPVLAYLLAHPAELRTLRGADLMMAYGPAFVLLMVLLPIQRGLTGRIRHLLTEQTRMEAMVNRDPLTGLYNRRFCEQVLESLLAQQVPTALVMFDMDRFKAINDNYGHPVGDAVLVQVAQCCLRLSTGEACIARWGGDEFMIVLPRQSSASVQAFCERLNAGIAALRVDPVGHVGASLGMALARDAEPSAPLLQRVDQALYRAKQRGGSQIAW